MHISQLSWPCTSTSHIICAICACLCLNENWTFKVVLLFSYQISLLLSHAKAFIYYHNFLFLSRTFLLYFIFNSQLYYQKFSCDATCLYYHVLCFTSSTFLFFSTNYGIIFKCGIIFHHSNFMGIAVQPVNTASPTKESGNRSKYTHSHTYAMEQLPHCYLRYDG